MVESFRIDAVKESMTLDEFASQEFHKILSVAQFATVGRNSIDKAIKSGELKAHRFGKKTIRIRTPDALAWLGIELIAQAKQ